MRFIGTLLTWVFASIVTYGIAIAAGQTLVNNMHAALGAEVTIGVRLNFIWQGLLGTTAYLGVILIGLGTGFYIASLVKAVLPVLSPIAYPTAGAAAIFVALSLMKMQFGIYPVPGGTEDLGLLVHMAAGALGGLFFEIFRGRDEDLKV
ncbi:MAG: hypothetical protein AAF603_01070 [Pseudomonadota bacterium]